VGQHAVPPLPDKPCLVCLWLYLVRVLQEEFFQETVRKVQALYKYDCLRANKSTMAWYVCGGPTGWWLPEPRSAA
jgi:hypothetical protein